MKFILTATDQLARRGYLQFERGAVQTPAFMPVGTYGTVKAMLPDTVREIGAEIILGNTFHLMLRPWGRCHPATWRIARFYELVWAYFDGFRWFSSF